MVESTPATGLLTIDLNALVANWRRLGQQLGVSAQCAAVVKADAYGLGMAPVARALAQAGCRYFFVATLDEAIALRSLLPARASAASPAVSGPHHTIVVLGGLFHGTGREWHSHQLVPVLYDAAQLPLWMDYCQRLATPLPAMVKVDTGMRRLGMAPQALVAFLQRQPTGVHLPLTHVMSHLACADQPQHELNATQQLVLQHLLPTVRAVVPNIKASLANSSGIFLGPDYHFDLVRPGAALYGVNPTPEQPNPMASVVNLRLPVMQVRTISAGESVGYGATFTAQRTTRLATVFGGYADGIFRGFGNRVQGYCGGVGVPAVGRVSMDSMVFDITALDGDPQYIELLNQHQGVDTLAVSAQTIGYEVLTRLGARYQRRWVDYEG